MPTVLGHALVGVGLGSFAVSRDRSVYQNVSAVASLAIMSATPDLDALAFAFGIPYSHPFGHRGFFHSAVFVVLLGGLFYTLGYLDRRGDLRPTSQGKTDIQRELIILFVCLAASISHPLLDMMTDGGLGIALLAPFSNERLFFFWQPIPVSPIGVSTGVLPVLKWELMVFGPAVLVMWAKGMLRWLTGSGHP